MKINEQRRLSSIENQNMPSFHRTYYSDPSNKYKFSRNLPSSLSPYGLRAITHPTQAELNSTADYLKIILQNEEDHKQTSSSISSQKSAEVNTFQSSIAKSDTDSLLKSIQSEAQKICKETKDISSKKKEVARELKKREEEERKKKEEEEKQREEQEEQNKAGAQNKGLLAKPLGGLGTNTGGLGTNTGTLNLSNKTPSLTAPSTAIGGAPAAKPLMGSKPP